MFSQFLNHHERPNISQNYFKSAYSKYFLSTVTVIHVIYLNIWQKDIGSSVRPSGPVNLYYDFKKVQNCIKYNIISLLFLKHY